MTLTISRVKMFKADLTLMLNTQKKQQKKRKRTKKKKKKVPLKVFDKS